MAEATDGPGGTPTDAATDISAYDEFDDAETVEDTKA